MEKIETKRIVWIDIARAISMCFVVLSHTVTYSEQLQWLNKYINSFAIMLFFILSGLTFKIKQNISYKQFFVRKFKSIMVPYFTFAILFLIPLYLFGDSTAQELGRTDIEIGLKKSIIGILYGNAHDNYVRQNSALWFLPCLFVLENIYYFIERLIRTSKKHYIAMIASLIIGFLDYQFLPIRLPWGADVAFVMIFFFALGKALMIYINKEKTRIIDNPIIQVFIAIICISLGAILQSFNAEVSCVHNYYGNYAIFIISALFSSIGYIYIFKNLPKIKFLEYIGKRTTAILVMHKAIVVLCQTKIRPVANLLNKSPYLSVELSVAILVTISACTLCLIAEKIIDKIFPEILGKQRKQSEERIADS